MYHGDAAASDAFEVVPWLPGANARCGIDKLTARRGSPPRATAVRAETTPGSDPQKRVAPRLPVALPRLPCEPLS